jgi:hypothetical protein
VKAKINKKAKTPEPISRVSVTTEVDLDGLLESLSLQFDTPEKFCQLLKLLDAKYENYDFTLAAAQFFVKEIRYDHKAGNEKFSYTSLFGKA